MSVIGFELKIEKRVIRGWERIGLDVTDSYYIR